MKKYNSKIIELFRHLDHAGCLEGEGVKTARDEFIALELAIRVKNHQIVEAAFRCQGSPILLAVSEYFCRCLEGVSLDEPLAISEEIILRELSLSSLNNHVVNKLFNLAKSIEPSLFLK
jgi:NifU-like protein involved in Fe-S cluster formation